MISKKFYISPFFLSQFQRSSTCATNNGVVREYKQLLKTRCLLKLLSLNMLLANHHSVHKNSMIYSEESQLATMTMSSQLAIMTMSSQLAIMTMSDAKNAYVLHVISKIDYQSNLNQEIMS